MKMIEMPFSYWNDLANQMIITSALLSGFSIAIVANLLVYNSDRRLIRIILKIATAAAGFFLISLFAIQSIAIKTSDSYPFELTHSAIQFPRIIGGIALMLGIIALCSIIALSGYTKSKHTGVFTTMIGIVTLIIIFLVL
jgi:phage shock protein PspC (stress-responsive transcriptional regulator)